MDLEKTWQGLKDVAKELEVNTRTVRRYFERGILPMPCKVGGRLKYPTPEIVDAVEKIKKTKIRK